MTTHPDAGSRTDGPALFIAGRWVRAGDGGVRECVNPTDGTVFATVDEATPEDAARAVAAARAAFDSGPWPSTSVGERAAVLHRIADLLARDREPLARIETDDTGQTLAESRMDVDDVIAVFRYYAGVLVSSADRVVDVGDRQVISRVTREPVGVCVLIAPWNYPLLQMSWKVAPALAAGCTMIMKPSEVTPLSTIAFTRLVEEAGVPDGVGGRLLLPADDLRPLRPDGAHRPGEDVRTDPHRGTLLHDC
ncbi:MAG TPA: aldehyde dehydrogenase family protein, partial [Microlunatus sp.]|nr:aldehyde dehydrogenase family protein [Microlunatus sp.]